MVKRLKALLADENGIAAIEYAVIASFMGLALLPILPGITEVIELGLTQLAEGF